MAKLILGAPVAHKIYYDLRVRLERLKGNGTLPRLTVVLVGDDPASLSYVAAKKSQAELLGIDFQLRRFSENISQRKLCAEVKTLNDKSGSCGIIIQLPLPGSLSRQSILDIVQPNLDVDGLTTSSQMSLSKGEAESFIPPTPAGIIRILDEYKISLKNKDILIVGSGDLVGKPLIQLFKAKGIQATVVTRSTSGVEPLYKKADIVIAATGKPGLITGKMLKQGVVVIDAGTAMVRSSGKMTMAGDVDFDSVSKVASAITPVPGGVGPVTVAMLYENLITSCERLSLKKD